MNLPLDRGCGDREYGRVLHGVVRPLARQYRPEVLLVSCGFDLYVHDRMSEMKVTPDGYALMAALLADIADEVCEGRIGFVMEGGYSLKGIRECGLKVMESLCGVPARNGERLRRLPENDSPLPGSIRKALEIHGRYWTF